MTPIYAEFETRDRKIMDIGNQGKRTLNEDGRERDFPKLETFLSNWPPMDFL